MPEMSSWPTQNSGPTGTVDSREAATHIGALVYPHTSAIKTKSGFRPGPGASPGVVTATGTPDAFVHVAPFQLMLQNIRGSGLGMYIACLDAQKDINILSTPADPTNPRDDLIVAQQSDIFDADANSDFVVRQVVGTPSPTPSDPAVSGSTNYVALARVRVNANATTITSGNITDLRTTGHAKSLVGGIYTVALGGILPVANQSDRDALTGLYDGMAVWRRDLKIVEIRDASAWRPQGMAKIDERILGSAAPDFTFSSIPANYRHLQLWIQCRGDTAATFVGLGLQFNSDTGTTYDTEQLAGLATTVAATEGHSGTSVGIGEAAAASALAGGAGSFVVHIHNYTGTAFWKLLTINHNLSHPTSVGQSASIQSKQWTGRWRNTNAITSIKVFPTAGNLVTGSTATLYGLP